MSTPEEWPMGPPMVNEMLEAGDRIDVSLMKLQGQAERAKEMVGEMGAEMSGRSASRAFVLFTRG